MLKPQIVCAACGLTMKCMKSGALAFQTERDWKNNVDGIVAVWSCDIYRCPGPCAKDVLTSFGDEPIAQSHEREKVERLLALDGPRFFFAE